MGYKPCKFCENHARDTPLRVVYIPHFYQILVKKFQFLGSYTLVVAPMTNGVKIGLPNFTPSMQRVAPAGLKTSKSASEQWRNWGFRRPGAEAVKCAPLESRHVSLTPTVHLLVKYTTVVVPSQQLPCSSVIFL